MFEKYEERTKKGNPIEPARLRLNNQMEHEKQFDDEDAKEESR